MEISGIKFFMTRGETIKEEKVKSITQNILSGTLVLENYEPYPGYFGGNLPPDIKPMSVFIALARNYDYLHIGRILRKISNERQHPCDGTSAIINLPHSHYFCVRIKNLECFSDINTIQESFVKHGLELHKFKNIDKTVLITVRKTFFLEKLDENIFKDLKEDSQYYFSPGEISDFERFRRLTLDVKYNMPNNLFDAALGYIWTLEGPTDIVRIFEKNNSLERVMEIKDYYQKAMNRLE